MTSSALGIVLGLLVGLRHAFEPDHLTAVSTLASDARGAHRGALLGALWGLGHTVSLVVVGSILVAAGATLPTRAATAFELGVAVMLLVLGVRAIAAARRRDPHHHVLPAPAPRRWRPFAVGLVHGLAGSGALTALVFAQLPGTAARLVYLAVFGAGSMAGMAIASGAAGATLELVARSPAVQRRIGVATGVVSIVVGVAWAIPLVV